MPVRRLLPLALLLLLPVVAAPAAHAGAGADADVPIAEARIELQVLSSKIRSSKSTNDDLLAALDEVERGYHSLQEPPAPAFEDVPSGALPEAVRAIQGRNRALERRHTAARKAFVREAGAYRSAVVKQLLRALTVTKLTPGKPPTNIRAPVNVRAAEILGGVESPKAAAALIRAIDGAILDAKYAVPAELVEEAFAALGRQGHEKSLAWLVDEFTHTKNSPPAEVEGLVAAHKAMILFPYDDISARGRFHVVHRCVTMYAGVETTARQGGASASERSAKELWDRIRNGVIQALQYYADAPKNDAGEVLATVDDFRRWLRAHKNPRGSPWSD